MFYQGLMRVKCWTFYPGETILIMEKFASPTHSSFIGRGTAFLVDFLFYKKIHNKKIQYDRFFWCKTQDFSGDLFAFLGN